MATRGRKPTPTKILQARGSWRAKAPNRAGEPQMEAITPEMPDGLGPAGIAEWQRIVPRLAEQRLLAEVDRTNLFLMCKSLDEMAQAQAAIAELGLLVAAAHGGTVLNPAVHERHRAWIRYTKHAATFGMTPSDRTRVKAGDVKETTSAGGMSQFFPKLA